MSLLTILAFFLGGGTLLVGADYFIELREQSTASSSSRGSPGTVTYLHECRGIPAGTPAINAGQSICTLVNSHDQKNNIYTHCNFIRVYRPNLEGHVIHLMNRGILSHQAWYLGFFNDAIDHPNFAMYQTRDLAHFAAEIDGLGFHYGLGAVIRNRIIIYYAQNNIISYSRDPDSVSWIFNAFAKFLKGLTERYFSIDQENEAEKLQYTAAMKMALQKMVDPCSIVQATASDSCNTYCHFLNLAALYFYVIWDAAASPINEGYCAGATCMCTRMNNPLAGCLTTPMQQCNNSLRLKLNF